MKTKNKAKILHFDLYGKREDKYDFLDNNSLESIEWTDLDVKKPNFFFVYKDYEALKEYEKGLKINEIFLKNTSGITTGNDKELVSKYAFEDNNNKYAYKPFDIRFINYDIKKIQRARYDIMKHFLNKNKNVSLCLMRTVVNTTEYKTVFITSYLMDKNFYGFQTYAFPLYLYPETDGQKTIEEQPERVPNFNMDIVKEIAENLGLTFEDDISTPLNVRSEAERSRSFAPIDILDYIYAVLHSPTYREKYKEFLKIDFPRVPYPKDKDVFWQLVKLGGEIRQIHLLESSKVEQYITQYPEGGDNVITRKITQNNPGYVADTDTHGKVYINDTQYFANVPLVAWEFYIGGYQPAQKWLKDRVGRTLDFEDILHYQKIIVALFETDRLMKKIDKIKIE